jgi:hypothetical protein
VVEPVPTALNCCVPRSTTVAVVGLIVMPTMVELPPHPATQAASNNATPSLANFIAGPQRVSYTPKSQIPKLLASKTFPRSASI